MRKIAHIKVFAPNEDHKPIFVYEVYYYNRKKLLIKKDAPKAPKPVDREIKKLISHKGFNQYMAGRSAIGLIGMPAKCLLKNNICLNFSVSEAVCKGDIL